MKFFLDTADVAEIRDWNATGLIDGVTTNPSLILKSGRDIKEVLAEICDIVDGDVSGEVAATDYDTMLREGRELASIADNICIKLPITMDGLRACKTLVDEGFNTNMTLCFNANQALLVAKAGGTYVSPFIGRLDDMGIDGMELIEDKILTRASRVRSKWLVFDSFIKLHKESLETSCVRAVTCREIALHRLTWINLFCLPSSLPTMNRTTSSVA